MVLGALWMCVSCASEDGVAEQRKPGVGGVGGASGSAGSSGEGGSWAGGASGSSGAAGSSGGAPVCPGYCGTLSSSACTGGKDEAACAAFCEAVLSAVAAIGCGIETEALLACYGAEPAAGFTCDANGEPVLPAGACPSQNDAVDACACDAACAAIAAASCPGTDQAACLQVCAALRGQCPACNDTYRALLFCEAGEPESSFQCDAQGAAQLVAPACAEQLADWQACSAAQCPAP